MMAFCWRINMAEIVRESNKILDWVKEKQRNEQEMLFRLNNVFKESIPRSKIRNVVLAAFEQMSREAANYRTGGPVIGALNEENGLAVWSRLAQPSNNVGVRLTQMTNQLIAGDQAVPQLDCNDFSELIRVIGTWLEKGGGFRVPNIHKAYRQGVGQVEAPYGPSMKYLAYLGKLRCKYGWQYADRLNAEERAELTKLATTGDYIARQDARDAKTWSEAVRQRESANQHHAIEEHVADYWVRPRFNNQSGMQRFRANRDDICKKIDLLFGFIVGATISGTTTDTAMVLEAFGAQGKLHAGYYIFPVATITASLHHSLLEAGLALTVVDAIDSYCAGFYTTLIPKGGLPVELQKIREILKKAEEAPKNRHLLIWYEGNEKSPAGCIRWNKPYELRDARRLVDGKGLLTHIMGMPRVPDKMAISRFLKLMAPKLLAYLPEEFQLR
jgi:hypothetical protein